MDYLIEVRVWSLGSDEAEELCERITDVLDERGLALRSASQEEEIRSMVSLKPQDGLLDATDGKEGLVIAAAMEGTQLLLVPGHERELLVNRPWDRR